MFKALFSRFLSRFDSMEVDDPVLGHLRYDWQSRRWNGTTWFAPASAEVAVSVRSHGSEVEATDRALFQSLGERYVALRPQIAQVLHSLYQSHVARPDAGMPAPQTAADMDRLTKLNRISVQDADTIELGYGFVDGAGRDDAMLTIRLKGWKAEGIALDA